MFMHLPRALNRENDGWVPRLDKPVVRRLFRGNDGSASFVISGTAAGRDPESRET